MMEKLWGDNFFDPSTKKWTKRDTGAKTCKRGFVQFVYEPIKTVIEACMNDNRPKLMGLLEKLGVTLKSEQKELSGKGLMKACMQTWIPASEVSDRMPNLYLLDLNDRDALKCTSLYMHVIRLSESCALPKLGLSLFGLCSRECNPAAAFDSAHSVLQALLEMMIWHLPSPAKAQKYRVENLYEGPLDDIYASAIRNCDPNGPLMLYVSKLIPAQDKGRFYAFGRVFAGKVGCYMSAQRSTPANP